MIISMNCMVLGITVANRSSTLIKKQAVKRLIVDLFALGR